MPRMSGHPVLLKVLKLPTTTPKNCLLASICLSTADDLLNYCSLHHRHHYFCLLMITAATSADWVDFWENEMTNNIEMNQEQIAAMLSVSEQIQEQIEVAGELWELSDFEVTALCGIVADAFAEKGIKMEALV